MGKLISESWRSGHDRPTYRGGPTPAPSAARTAGTLRFAGAPRSGLSPAIKRKVQINPGLSLSLDEKRGSRHWGWQPGSMARPYSTGLRDRMVASVTGGLSCQTTQPSRRRKPRSTAHPRVRPAPPPADSHRSLPPTGQDWRNPSASGMLGGAAGCS
jgi:hypothetical protein